ncbi:Hint domain-containing protein [Ruegeria sp. 2012CJ41-6]|uniref:Hint domain-containing protein n=1 Tax=Ruegeria spongiae TaxID=2942209 RepID=A0ABT0PZJ7_9RHOB|nr:Hint domain-containing protein [Ruegeria spongiae]MCL6283060.1 Hint domain-containing protein [Ruegeria spongiae]
MTGTAWSTFTSLGVVGTITISDDDSFGIGDNLPDTETAALPVITAVSGTLPAGWVGLTLSFGWQQQIDGTGGPDALGMVIGGGTNFIPTHLVQYPGGTPIVTGTTYSASGIANVPSEIVVCFASGTQIQTVDGEVSVEELKVGDLIITKDNGPQPIRWIGATRRFAQGDMAPVVFQKGAIGNSRTLKLSPQHRLLISGWRAELLFGEDEVLIPAKALVNDSSIRFEPGGYVDYYHVLFDTHEIIISDGVPTESLFPADQSLDAMSHNARDEILDLFPDLADRKSPAFSCTARTSIGVKEGRLLAPENR